MREYWNDSDFRSHKRRKRAKHGALHRFINSLLLLCFCLTVIVLTISFLTNGFPFAANNLSNAYIGANAAANIDFSTGSATDMQSDTNETEWCLVLVNKWNGIPDNYEVELTELENGQSVDSRVYPALQKMFDAARNDGVYPVVVSGYRTEEKQQSLLDEKIDEYRAAGYSAEEAVSCAEAWVALPGTSEHQLGIAVDINADGINSAGYEVYEWLEKNAHKYGFILRYPAGKTEITGINNEPWHYRYVGIQAAAEIYSQGICLEEYLGKAN